MNGRESATKREVYRSAGTTDSVVAGVRLTNPGRIMYPEKEATKLDLARYYEDIEEWILPYLANRPLSLLRCPQGRQTECFFQKHSIAALAKRVPRIAIADKNRGTASYVYVRSLSDLVALVQAGVLEFHPWGSLGSDVEHPDIMIFDFDPGPDTAWSEVLRRAKEMRDRLASLGLTGFPRTTGGKGVHVVVPLIPKASWDEVKHFGHALSVAHARDDPKRLTTHMSKTKRRGRIFIDYLRNARGNTAIACYSLRARPYAPVATPLRWDELSTLTAADHYHIGNIRRRLQALTEDPWTGFIEARATITERMRNAVGLR